MSAGLGRGLHGLGSWRRRAGYPAAVGRASRPAATTGAGTATTVAALTVTLGPAAACWAVAVWQMNQMDMGMATRVGPFGVFLAVWTAMMAAMMLPGGAPAVIRRAQAGGAHAAPVFIGSYLAVWATAVYAVDRPHGSAVAGVTLIVAGAYEITPAAP